MTKEGRREGQTLSGRVFPFEKLNPRSPKPGLEISPRSSGSGMANKGDEGC